MKALIIPIHPIADHFVLGAIFLNERTALAWPRRPIMNSANKTGIPTAKIEINMENINNISKDVDFDGIITHIGEQIAEATVNGAEAVHI